MDVLIFLNNLNLLSEKHKNTWIDILTNCIHDKISVDVILKRNNISRSTLFRLLSMQNDGFLVENKKRKIKIKNNLITLEKEIENKKEVVKVKPKTEKVITEIEQIIEYLNFKSGKSFSYKSKNSTSFISARLKEGYKIEDFKKVIDIKCHKWLNSKFEDYLRPQTLFSNKMDGYLNENIVIEKDKVDKANDTINKAKQFDWTSY